jgi:hypothetical protein
MSDIMIDQLEERIQRLELRIAHAERFRQVSNRYPRRVAEAYGGDLAAAARASDEEVAQAVAKWERDRGIVSKDWPAIGAEERDEV